MRTIFCLITLIGFIVCITPDASASNCSESGESSLVSSSKNVDHVTDYDLIGGDHDCHQSHCGGEACETHCHGHHNILTPKTVVKLSANSSTTSKRCWNYSNHYKNPFIDLGIMPPIFS